MVGLLVADLVPVTEFHLYSSRLRPDGALHRIEASYPLFDMAEINA